MAEYAHEVAVLLGAEYPELVEKSALIDGILTAEEERFGATLDAGESKLTAELEQLEDGAQLSGEVAFLLHDTYGFPIDLTREIAANAGHVVDMDAFDAAMTEQRERARKSANRDAWGNAQSIWAHSLTALMRPSLTATTQRALRCSCCCSCSGRTGG